MKKGIPHGFILMGVILSLFLLIGGVAADTPGGKEVLTFAAASLTGASGDLGTEFQATYPAYSVTWNLAGTQEIKTQVENGATPDLFLSASAKYTKEMKNQGWFVNDTVKNLTSNWITVIIPSGNPGKITSLKDLSKPGVKIAMGTKDVPVGINTIAVLDKMANSSEYGTEYRDAVINNTVTYEVSEPGVVGKVELGEVDAGFVYLSSSIASKDKVKVIEIPKEINAIQYYSVAVMTEANDPEGAGAFEEFLLSDAGQDILGEYGFTPVS